MQPTQILWESVRALLPALVVDTAGATAVYFVLAPHFPENSVWPVLGASLVPIASNVFNFVRRRTFDVIGLIVLLGLIVGALPAAFGASGRVLLLGQSFLTALIGLAFIVATLFMRESIMYYVAREVLTANDALPQQELQALWRSPSFSRGAKRITIAWGVVLLGEFWIRAVMSLRWNVGLVIAVGPFVLTGLLVCAGLLTAVWFRGELARALAAVTPQNERGG